jgi:hypothetical protein
MELDADCLHEARVENLERLAASLGVRLPPRKGDHRKYARQLVRVVLRGLDEDRRRQRRNPVKLGEAPRPPVATPTRFAQAN